VAKRKEMVNHIIELDEDELKKLVRAQYTNKYKIKSIELEIMEDTRDGEAFSIKTVKAVIKADDKDAYGYNDR